MKSYPFWTTFLVLIIAKFPVLENFRLLLRAESQRINPHLLHHCYKSVAPGGRQMLLQSNLLDEVEVGIQNLLRRMAAEHPDQQTYNALYDHRIALSLKVNDNTSRFSAVLCQQALPSFGGAGGGLRHQPHATLATVNQVLLRLELLVKRLQIVAQINQQLVLVHPVVKAGELLNDLVLYLVYAHFYLPIFIFGHKGTNK